MRNALATLVALACVGTASANVTVTGTGKVTYKPNLADVSVTVSSDAATAADAWQKNAQIVKKLFEVLQKFGIDHKDFKTTGLNVSPRYSKRRNTPDCPPELVGYTVSYDLAITVRRLDRLGALLDALVAGGANRGLGIRFGIDDPEALLQKARQKAVTDARQKAELYVKAAGARLGGLVSINEGSASAVRYLRFEQAAPGAADALLIAAGQQELAVSVTVTYAVGREQPVNPWTLPSRP
jgi:uncharacterized protein YggE